MRLATGAALLTMMLAALAPLVCELNCAVRPAPGATEFGCHRHSSSDRLAPAPFCAHDTLAAAPEATVRRSRGVARSGAAIFTLTPSTRALDRPRVSWLAHRSGAPHVPLRSPSVLRI